MSNSDVLQVSSDWKRLFSFTVLRRGEDYYRTGRVQSCQVKPNGVDAIVQGADRDPYVVSVEFVRAGPKMIDIAGKCTCPKGFNCKHVAAAIFKALAKSPSTGRRTQRPTETPRKEPVPSRRTLPQDLDQWLQRVEQTAKAASGPRDPDQVAVRLGYVLRRDKKAATSQTSGTQIDVYVVRRLAAGNYGLPEYFYFDLSYLNGSSALPEFILPEDEALLTQIQALADGPSHRTQLSAKLPVSMGAWLLEQVLRTKRCYWRSADGKRPPLSLGAARAGRPAWTFDQHGNQCPTVEVTPAATAHLCFAPPWYIDESTSTCGPIEMGLAPAVAATWLQAPSLTPDDAALMAVELAARPDFQGVPAPLSVEVEVIKQCDPVPCLRLFSVRVRSQYGWSHLYTEPDKMSEVNLAEVQFDYLGCSVEATQSSKFAESFADGKLRRILRKPGKEGAAVQLLMSSFGFARAGLVHSLYSLGKHERCLSLPDDQQWLDFHQRGLLALRADGWQIQIDDTFGFRIVEPEEWYADATEGSGLEWFDVEVGVQIDGKRINLLPVLLTFLKQNPRALDQEYLAKLGKSGTIPVRLEDKRLFAFPAQRLRDMLGLLAELYDTRELGRDGRLRLRKLRAAEVAAWNNTEWRWLGNKELREFSRKLHNFSSIKPVPPSPQLQASLRPYQQEGLNWLQFLREYNLAGILADDMGLGKTVQTLAHLLHEKESGRMDRPSLVVAPTSLMTNWRQETERFAPTLKVLVLHGPDRKQHFPELGRYDLIITSYALLPRDQEVLLGQPFHCAILDEAQYIKNPKTKYAQVVSQLQARHHLCLTGTPMENHLGELWSLFNFLLPGFLGDELQFRRIFRTPIERDQNEDRRKQLARRIGPFLLRRRKEEVLKELPPKTEIIQNVELSEAQRDLYETIRLAMHQRVREEVSQKGFSRAQIIILDALLKLRQVCCDPRLLKMEAARKVEDSAKLELLMDLLPEMIAEGRRILLFSQFTSMLRLIEQELAEIKQEYVLLTGSTTDRATPIDRFQKGEVPLFLISLKAGGTGLNLTAADTVIHYDPWWNPAVENQATDRAHRIGQDKKVFVYKLMTVGTVEEKIGQLQARKRALVEGLLNENTRENLKLTQEDLDVLFAPLR